MSSNLTNIRQMVSWSAVNTTTTTALQFFRFFLIASLLPISEFGSYSLSLLIIMIVIQVQDFGLSNAIIIKNIQSVDTLRLFRIFCIGISILSSVVIYTICSSLLSDAKPYSFFYFLINMSPACIFASLGHLSKTKLQAKFKLKHLAQVNIFSEMIAITFISTYFMHGSLNVIAASVNILYLSNSLIALAFANDWEELKLSNLKLPTRIGILEICRYQTLERLLNNASAHTDKFFISKIFGIEALALYNFSYQIIITPFTKLIAIVSVIILPYMSNHDDRLQRKHVFYVSLIIYFIFISLIFNITNVWSSEILSLFFGNKWLHASFLIEVFSIIVIAKSVISIVSTLALSQEKAKFNFYWNLYSLFCILSLIVYSYVQNFGFENFLYGLLIVNMINLIVFSLYIIRILPFFFDFNIWNPMMQMTLIISVYCVLTLFGIPKGWNLHVWLLTSSVMICLMLLKTRNYNRSFYNG